MKESFWRSKKTKLKSLQLSPLNYKIERPPFSLFQIKIYCKMILIETQDMGIEPSKMEEQIQKFTW